MTEETTKKIMCPACKGAGIRKQISLKGHAFKRKKVITFYCPLCHFENKHEFEISREDYETEVKKKSAEATKELQYG